MPFRRHATPTPLPAAGAVIGLDVGYSPEVRDGAIRRLEWSADAVGWTIVRFRAEPGEMAAAVGRVAGGRDVLAAAFDGPMGPGLAPILAYRAAERLPAHRFQPFVGKPGAPHVPIGRRLNAQTNACAALVLDAARVGPARHADAIHDRAIVEAFPSPFMGLMIEDPKALATRRGNRADVYYAHLAATPAFDALAGRFLPGRRLGAAFGSVTNHDDRAALVCALGALCVAGGEFTAVGDAEGWVVLPPWEVVRGWVDWVGFGE